MGEGMGEDMGSVMSRAKAGLSWRHRLIGLGLGAISAARLPALLGGRLAGLGVILTFHRVCPPDEPRFALNRLLEITPQFFETVLGLLRKAGYDIIPIDALRARLAAPDPSRPFAILTFDDGYVDTLHIAAPILARHQAPFTVYVAPGFADRQAMLWWQVLEDVFRQNGAITLFLPDGSFSCPPGPLALREKGFRALYWRLRKLDEAGLRAAIMALAREAGIDPFARTARDCLDWAGLETLAALPGVTIGAHSLTHPRLAKLDADACRAEIGESKTGLETRLARKIAHFAYPIGDRASAGPREFAYAAQAGFETGVTTRPGFLFAGHAGFAQALPRLSVNGLFQSEAAFSALLSGLPFALLQCGRRLDVAD